MTALIAWTALAALPACTVDQITFSSPDAAPAAPEIRSFQAQSALLVRGAPTTLVADFLGGAGTIDHGVGAVVSGQAISITPSEDTVYTLTVTSSDGSATATAATTVEVAAAFIEVTSAAVEGQGTLYSAVSLANRSNGDERLAIVFTLPTPATIAIPATLVFSSEADVLVAGPGADRLTITGGNARRLLFVRNGAVELRGLTLTAGLGAGGNGGRGIGGGSGGGGAGMGGAIFINNGSVTLRDLVFTNNVARGGSGGTSAGSGAANGGGGGGFGSDGSDGSVSGTGQGGPGGSGGDLGGTGGAAGAPGNGDGAGGGGAGAGVQQNGGPGAFGAGGGGSGGFPNSGAGGFGGGAGAGANPQPGTFGGTANGTFGGGGAGLGGAIFLRSGALAIHTSTFRDNQALAGPSLAGVTFAGKAKAGAIFSLVQTVTLDAVTFTGSAAADASDTTTDNANLYVTQPLPP